MTSMELSIQAWCLNFQTLWLELCATVPTIQPGTSPVRDLAKTKRQDSRDLVWYYYPSRKFRENYWDDFDTLMGKKHPTVNFGVASSEYFTTIYDFGYEDGDEIPDLILVCFDIPGPKLTF